MHFSSSCNASRATIQLVGNAAGLVFTLATDRYYHSGWLEGKGDQSFDSEVHMYDIVLKEVTADSPLSECTYLVPRTATLKASMHSKRDI